MPAFANNDWMKALTNQFHDAPMRHTDQRARRFQDIQPACSCLAQSALRSPMRRNHNGLRRYAPHVLLNANSPRLQLRQHRFVVNQIPRMVRGLLRAVTFANAMASLTPKHIPKCSARMIFIFRFLNILCTTKLKTMTRIRLFKN